MFSKRLNSSLLVLFSGVSFFAIGYLLLPSSLLSVILVSSGVVLVPMSIIDMITRPKNDTQEIGVPQQKRSFFHVFFWTVTFFGIFPAYFLVSLLLPGNEPGGMGAMILIFPFLAALFYLAIWLLLAIYMSVSVMRKMLKERAIGEPVGVKFYFYFSLCLFEIILLLLFSGFLL